MTVESDLSVLATLNPSNPLHRGQMLHIVHSPGTAEPLRKLVQQMLGGEVKATYRPPWAARLLPHSTPTPDYRLTPADLELIRRLPRVPAKVDAEDARHLALLEMRLRDNYSDDAVGDRRLVAQVLEPVRAHHERLARAEVLEVEANRVPLPQPPAPLVEGLRQALLEEIPELHSIEVTGRIQRALSDPWKEHQTAINTRRVEAASELAEVRRELVADRRMPVEAG